MNILIILAITLLVALLIAYRVWTSRDKIFLLVQKKSILHEATSESSSSPWNWQFQTHYLSTDQEHDFNNRHLRDYYYHHDPSYTLNKNG